MKEGDLRVWHIPQVPGEPFHVAVPSVEVAAIVINALADYDAFQYANHIKPDYANASGLEWCDGERWEEWESEEGKDIEEVMQGEVQT